MEEINENLQKANSATVADSAGAMTKKKLLSSKMEGWRTAGITIKNSEGNITRLLARQDELASDRSAIYQKVGVVEGENERVRN